MTKKIILFDGECNYCTWWINFLLRRDKKDIFRFAALQSGAGKNLCESFNITSEIQRDSFILIEGEKYFTSSTAGLRLLKHLGGGWKFFYALIIIPKHIRDFFYGILSRNRYRWFGKRECMVPDEGMKGKFLV